MKKDKKYTFFRFLNIIILLGLLLSLIPFALYENKKSAVVLPQNEKDIFLQYFQNGRSTSLFMQSCIDSVPPVIDAKIIIYNDRTISFQCRTENTSYENFPPLSCKISEQDFQSLIDRIENSHLLTLDDKYNFKFWSIDLYEQSPFILTINTKTMQKEFRSWVGIDKYALGLQNDMRNLCKKYGLIDLWKETYFSTDKS